MTVFLQRGAERKRSLFVSDFDFQRDGSNALLYASRYEGLALRILRRYLPRAWGLPIANFEPCVTPFE